MELAIRRGVVVLSCLGATLSAVAVTPCRLSVKVPGHGSNWVHPSADAALGDINHLPIHGVAFDGAACHDRCAVASDAPISRVHLGPEDQVKPNRRSVASNGSASNTCSALASGNGLHHHNQLRPHQGLDNVPPEAVGQPLTASDKPDCSAVHHGWAAAPLLPPNCVSRCKTWGVRQFGPRPGTACARRDACYGRRIDLSGRAAGAWYRSHLSRSLC